MLDYAMMRSVALLVLGVATMGCAAEQDAALPLAVTLATASRVLVAGHTAELEVVLRNAGDDPIAFDTWSCGWDTQWRIRQDNDTVAIAAAACTRNVRRTIRLAAGETHARRLALVAHPTGGPTAVRLALGFQPLDASHLYWTAPLVFNVAPGDLAARDDVPTP